MAGLILGMVAATLLTTALRHELRTKCPWIAAGIALLIWAPNLAWQVAEGFPTLTYLGNHSGSGGGPVTYPVQFGGYFFFVIPVWLAGMILLFRNTQPRPHSNASHGPPLPLPF